jgi:hypothetical protein
VPQPSEASRKATAYCSLRIGTWKIHSMTRNAATKR